MALDPQLKETSVTQFSKKHPKLTGVLMGVLLLLSSVEWTYANQTALKPIGTATAYWASIIPVYDAALQVSENTTQNNLLSEQTAINLELCYRTSLSAENFVDAANQALPEKLTPDIQSAVDSLHRAYQDVNQSDCYQLSFSPKTGTELRLNNELKFQDKTPGFKSTYFGIWLGDDPLSPSVKQDLVEGL